MANKESRYTVDVKFTYTIKDQSKTEPGTEVVKSLVYKGMDYLQICVTQDLLREGIAEVEKKLVDAGFVAAAAVGFGPEMEKMKGPKK